MGLDSRVGIQALILNLNPNITNTTLGAPYYNYGIWAPKPYSNYEGPYINQERQKPNSLSLCAAVAAAGFSRSVLGF